jgi:hypothetical protein
MKSEELGQLLVEVAGDLELPVSLTARDFSKPLYNAMTSVIQESPGNFARIVEVNEETAILSAKLFSVFLGCTRVSTQLRNKENNLLLARNVVESVKEGKVNLWRFVCMPKTTMIKKDNKFDRWEADFSTTAYNTLSPALFYDRDLLSKVLSLGLVPKLTYVLDDWEVPYIRMTDITETGFSKFKSLSQDERDIALKSLVEINVQVRSWIDKMMLAQNIRIPDFTNVRFLSGMIDYYEFIELMDTLFLEMDIESLGIFKQELEFAEKYYPNINRQTAGIMAGRRITQYATEAVVINNDTSSEFKNGIFLNSEYPTLPVWQKLNLVTRIPTLFYAEDEVIKNI